VVVVVVVVVAEISRGFPRNLILKLILTAMIPHRNQN
jgi:hypothetical protein